MARADASGPRRLILGTVSELLREARLLPNTGLDVLRHSREMSKMLGLTSTERYRRLSEAIRILEREQSNGTDS